MKNIKSEIQGFLFFLSLLSKKWILWLFLVLDLLTVAAQLVFPSLSLSHSIFLSIAAIGVIWAAYLVYNDLLIKFPTPQNNRSPEVSCYFVSGNEYSFQLQLRENLLDNKGEKSASESKTTVPWSFIYLNVTLQNTGHISVKVLSVDGNVDFRVPYHFMLPQGHDSSKQPLNYPFELKPHETINIVVGDPIQPTSYLTDAQIAARTRPLKIQRETTNFSVSIEFTDNSGKIYSKDISTSVSLLPLCDLYIAHWNHIGRIDLVDLATEAQGK